MNKRIGLVASMLILAGMAAAQQKAANEMAGTALPSGTAVKMKLETPISTHTSKAGDTFSGRVTEPVALEGRTVIPVGAALEGQVVRVSEPRRVKGRPTIVLRPESVTMPNGEKYSLNAVVVDTSRRPQMDVTDEGRIKGRGYDNRDVREVAVGTGAGAAVGGIAAGGHGLLIGAGVGATATVVHWLTKHKSADLPAGTEIVMELSRPMNIAAAKAGD